MSYVTKLMSNANLTKAIKSIKNRGKKLDTDTQIVLVQSLLQMQPMINKIKHDNYDYAGQVIQAMGRSQRANAAITYIQSHSPAVAQYDGKKFTGFKKAKGKDAVKLNIVAAEQVNFWDFKVESAPVTITLESLEKRVETLFKTADKELTDLEMVALKKTVRLAMAA